MRIYHVCVGMLIEEVGDIVQGSRQEQIIRIQPSHYLSGRLCESAVYCMSLPSVLDGLPSSQQPFVTFQDFNAAVRGTAVLNHVLDVRVFLFDYASNGELQ